MPPRNRSVAAGGLAWLAFAGSVPFFTQTAILDALIWPATYPHL